MVTVVRSEFTGPRGAGDFRWMIEQPDYATALFVFNDNEEQFREHRQFSGTTHSCLPGGGNATIRPYQCVPLPRAVGIPTGSHGGYTALDERTRAVIDEAIGALRELLDTGRYDRVIYSWNARTGTLGTGIFEVDREVTDYIVAQIDRAAGDACHDSA